ncbi:protein tyrosine phosphatase [Klebsiella pneumoniae]|uniref:arsenate reductase/protein-tyrosine-phosphatase family protein n=1 Tax=Klebsiella pneumoniae complex TaxID=3390273 RepID=UPI000C2B1E5F|nr:protein tyrosine phosphatase [Klebsiella pneumoniae]MBC4066328.1 protein tyrosine phosphatase [Klebsiella pneumoniae]MDZ1530972.1 protein tyrosine phosphatase [Klebsiella pneumoniae]QUX16434.1 protein tyrosine phosphatase [Klebsiella pneumoniae]
MFESILVVCTGNICRSPIAERLLRNHLTLKKIDSAGTGALVGHEADETAALICEKNGFTLDGHKGQQFTSSLARKYDLILVMEKEHIEKISEIAPEARGKTMLLGYWIGQKEIPDPYRKSYEAFESVFGTINHACKSWIDKLNK